MLRLPEFEYVEPETMADAAAILDEHGDRALAVAGGTDVVPKLKRRQMRPDVIVNLRRVGGLRSIEESDDGVRIGALTTLASIENDPIVRSTYPGVVEAVESVATPHHRRMGTIGGNLCQDTRCYYYDQTLDWREGQGWCRKAPDPDGWPPDGDTIDEIPCRTVPGSKRCWAIFASDPAPILIAHGATVTLLGTGGERTIPLADFYEDDGIDPRRRRHDELLTSVHLPAPDGLESTYRKLAQREAFDFPSLGVAAAVEQADDGTIDRARVVLGAVSTHPVVVESAGEVLEGGRVPDEDLISDVGQAAKRAARPMDNDDLPPAHRSQMAEVYTKRALTDLLEGDRGTNGTSRRSDDTTDE